MKAFSILIILFISVQIGQGQTTWVDEMDKFAREQYMPANKYKWTWQSASLLRSMVIQYELRPEGVKSQYLEYIKGAMNNKAGRAHGSRPNAVASAHGMAFLSRILGDKKYQKIANKIYREYLKIPRTESGGIAHLARTPELWDDTIYMIGVFLLEMYRTTGEEKYLDDFLEQFRIHREKLIDEATGLWVHGWDGNDRNRCALCGQRDWPDEATRRSTEIWGKGKWLRIVVILSDALKTVPKDHPYWEEMAGYLYEMIEHLPAFQDQETGHWFQLPTLLKQEDNFIESSCTAMFSYGILTALQLDIAKDEKFKKQY